MIRWPWSKALEAAKAEERAATECHAEAINQRKTIEQQNVEAVKVTRVLRHQLDANGWTDLLRETWGAK